MAQVTAQSATSNKALMTMTSSATQQIKTLLSRREKPSLGIRVGIKSGGCSGQSYYIEYADSKNPYDEVITQDGVNVLVDPKAMIYIIGTEMDYQESEFKSGFIFNNPNEKGQCGCGKSFSV